MYKMYRKSVRQTVKLMVFIAIVLVAICVITKFTIFFSLKCLNNQNRRIATVIHGGGLGNKIWEYMSLFAVTHLIKQKVNVTAYCPDRLKANLEEIFETVSLPDDSKLPNLCYNEQLYVLQKNESVNITKLESNNDSILLDAWSARYEDILEFGIDKMKKELRFRRIYSEYSNTVLNNIRKSYRINHDDVIFVGMHYRGTDYINLLEINYKYFNGPPDYTFYLQAMSYFKQKYKNVIFILITIDFDWLKQNLPFLKENNLVVNPNEDDHLKDLALLSHCNHSIINYGTFGATAALFAGGTTFIYDLKIPLDYRGPTIAMGLAKSLLNWHII